MSITSLTPAATSIQVDVSTDDGGSPLSGYQYRLDGGSWTSAETTAEPFTISGLATGRSYEVEVRVVNSAGVGPASPTASATPRTVPAAVSEFSATGLDSSASLSWAPPTNDGGSAVSDFVVQFATSASGPWTTFADATSATNSAVVTGLTNGTTYLFRVSAVNAAGSGAVSSLASATPLAVPSAPNLTGLTAGSQYMQASFIAPGSNGGTPVTGYQYQLNGGEWRNAAGTSSPMMLAGLSNGQDYTVAIRAVNAVGGGAASNVRTGRPFGLPSAIEGFVASPSGTSVTLDWDEAHDNGSPITEYNIIRWSARTEGSIVASYQTTDTSHTVTGLSPGTSYYFTIEARNAAGAGPRSAPRHVGHHRGCRASRSDARLRRDRWRTGAAELDRWCCRLPGDQRLPDPVRAGIHPAHTRPLGHARHLGDGHAAGRSRRLLVERGDDLCRGRRCGGDGQPADRGHRCHQRRIHIDGDDLGSRGRTRTIDLDRLRVRRRRR
ncbi:MAG: fibronectin type III domain-containing protein [Microthrixaceae bacterium]